MDQLVETDEAGLEPDQQDGDTRHLGWEEHP
jgi:hypothetical protein